MRFVLAAVLVVAAGCSKKQDGLPPATEWQASPGEGAQAAKADPAGGGELPELKPPPGMTSHGGNPHAGMDMGDGEGGDPHAGADMGGGGGDGSDPHAGLGRATGPNPHTAGGGLDVTKMGLNAPDPDRKIDPSHKITGMITLDAKAKATLKAGTSIFLIVKRAGADGAPTGTPLAVDKLTWADGGVPFELTDEQAMIAGTDLTGDVVVMARYDQDSDALSKSPGDVTGQVRVKIPAVNVKLPLDTVLP
ncbi:MAG TPA: hypothetical protein VFP84_35110 [Kofleriaceae bacterium]|nr:hypothetical protein [Kofleriaceae bacterium]